jgi:hypothetical protein
MSVMMMLEMDCRSSEEAIREALVDCGVSTFVPRGEGFDGNFPSSNMFFLFEPIDDGRVKAEDCGVEWRVGGEMTFVYVISKFDECSKQLHNFLQHLSSATSSNWILSFQYESVCAIRDDVGVHFIKDF